MRLRRSTPPDAGEERVKEADEARPRARPRGSAPAGRRRGDVDTGALHPGLGS